MLNNLLHHYTQMFIYGQFVFLRISLVPLDVLKVSPQRVLFTPPSTCCASLSSSAARGRHSQHPARVGGTTRRVSLSGERRPAGGGGGGDDLCYHQHDIPSSHRCREACGRRPDDQRRCLLIWRRERHAGEIPPRDIHSATPNRWNIRGG